MGYVKVRGLYILLWRTIVVVTALLGALFLGLGGLLAKLAKHLRANNSPLECGFSSVLEARQFVSFRFFVFAVVFLIFDVELILLVPYLFGSRRHLAHTAVVSVAITLLRLGLLLE